MTKVDAGMPIFAIAEIIRGVAASSYSFRRIKDSRMCVKRLCKGRNLDEDDVHLFETTIDPLIDRQ